MTAMTVFGEPVADIGDDIFAVTIPGDISEATIASLKRDWRALVGERKRLVVIAGATGGVTRIGTRTTLTEPAPIFDALVAERGWPA